MILPLADYQRIFNVINSLILSDREFFKHSPERSCTWFALFGAAILIQKYHKIAKVFSGEACIAVGVDTEGRLLICASKEANFDEGMHCWIECEGYAIDFQAPLLEERMARMSNRPSIPRKMFQKKVDLMTGDLEKVGDYYFNPDRTLSQNAWNLLDVPSVQDHINGLLKWYQRPPVKMMQKVGIIDQNGQSSIIKLNRVNVVGCW